MRQIIVIILYICGVSTLITAGTCIIPGSFTLVETGSGPYNYTFTVDLDTISGNDTKAIEITFMLSDGTEEIVCFPPPLSNPIIHSMASVTSGLSGSLTYTSWTANNGSCQGGSCSGGIVLPIHIRSLTTTVMSGRVILHWIAENTAQDLAYVVERSTDLLTFKAIGRIDVHHRSFGQLPFELVDHAPPYGEVFYRIREIALDGGETISRIVTATVPFPAVTSVYPNPVGDRLYLMLDRTLPENTMLRFTHSAGTHVEIAYAQIAARGYVDVSYWSPGIWFLDCDQLGTLKVVKF